ncbi:family 16 glycosylhydrolase [Winogradskyella maritima]|uniref:Family 16 glycosylhydrolase n=1 Tax=Winogradskyella maritima TaxID=1517766 RepID=A0ABV8ADU0_9FLAO|nr:family 16 glycosylhydrolase [Winogradskyella maritima]
MKNFQYKGWLVAFFSILILTGCQEDDIEFGDITTPTNLTVSFNIVGQDTDNPNGDGSGLVEFAASADNAITYRFDFGDGTEADVAPNGTITHRFVQQGLNTYNITAIASGTGGVTTSSVVAVQVFSAFDDVEARSFLTGAMTTQDNDGNLTIDNSQSYTKTWYLAASEPGHLGVGPSLDLDLQIFGTPTQFYFPAFFAATPNNFCDDFADHCLCNDELTFSIDTNNEMTYQLNNNGQTFFNGAHQAIVGGPGGEDLCLDFDTSGTSTVTLAPGDTDWSLVPDPSFEARATQLNFSDGGFMGYYVSSSTYEIIEITEDFLYVRTIDGLDPALAWYHKFSTTPPGADSDADRLSDITIYNNLTWEDDFNTDGAPDPSRWTYDIGTGDNGWGNGEAQYYTDRADNVIVSNGNLVITAKSESFNGSAYTSARIKSQDLYEFTNGRVEIRAKLPEGQGTWPALWMLGANFPEVGWPVSGELDIMEQTGQDKSIIKGTAHYPAVSPGTGNTADAPIENATSEFHIYSLEWTPEAIYFALDDEIFHTVPNNADLPFNADFFFIMNVAMGGTLGGTIATGFDEATMEVDYIRVYQ